MTQNHWKMCIGRTEALCKAHNITASMDKGNGRCGVSYCITFWIGSRFLHELRDRSPSALYDKLAAFDWGMESAKNIASYRAES
jgi:hypothetical protein